MRAETRPTGGLSRSETWQYLSMSNTRCDSYRACVSPTTKRTALAFPDGERVAFSRCTRIDRDVCVPLLVQPSWTCGPQSPIRKGSVHPPSRSEEESFEGTKWKRTTPLDEKGVFIETSNAKDLDPTGDRIAYGTYGDTSSSLLVPSPAKPGNRPVDSIDFSHSPSRHVATAGRAFHRHKRVAGVSACQCSHASTSCRRQTPR